MIDTYGIYNIKIKKNKLFGKMFWFFICHKNFGLAILSISYNKQSLSIIAVRTKLYLQIKTFKLKCRKLETLKI